ELQILVCFNHPQYAIETYKERWQIETLFRAIKSSGFNIEDTHLRDMERISRLVAMVCVALVWAYLVGEHKDINVKKIRMMNHGYRAKSLVKYGLEEIADVLNRPWRNPDFDVFKFLSCS
ncbi:transposase, partial [uncultured Muribaculum sp.]